MKRINRSILIIIVFYAILAATILTLSNTFVPESGDVVEDEMTSLGVEGDAPQSLRERYKELLKNMMEDPNHPTDEFIALIREIEKKPPMLFTEEKARSILAKARTLSDYELIFLEQINEDDRFISVEWDEEIEAMIEVERIVDAKTALSVGSVLLAGLQERGLFNGYIPQSLVYQEHPTIWIITCWRDYDSCFRSSAVCFALRGDNARIDNIWMEQGSSVPWAATVGISRQGDG